MTEAILNETAADDHSDIDVDNLISETYTLTNKLLAISVMDALEESKNQVISDIEADLWRWSKNTNEYLTKLSNLRKLEQGIIHKAIGMKNLTNVERDLLIFTDRLDKFKELISKNIVAKHTDIITATEVEEIRKNSAMFAEIKGKVTNLMNHIDAVDDIHTASSILERTSEYTQKISSNAATIGKTLANGHKHAIEKLSNELHELLQNNF